MSEKKFQNIPVHTTTKAKLDRVMGNESYNDFILTVLNFQEVTGTDFKNVQAYPSVIMVNELTRLIKIVKAFERDKVDPLMDALGVLPLPAKGAGRNRKVTNVPGISAPGTSDEALAIELAEQVAAKNAKLEVELRDATLKIQELEARKPLQQIQIAPESIDIKEAEQLIAKLEESATKNRFNQEQVIIRSDIFLSIIERMKKNLKLG